MSPKSQTKRYDDPVSGDLADERIASAVQSELDKENTRQRVQQIIEDYVGTVDFMDKVKEYASREIDDRMFKSIKFWAAAVLIPIAVAVIGTLITYSLVSKKPAQKVSSETSTVSYQSNATAP